MRIGKALSDRMQVEWKLYKKFREVDGLKGILIKDIVYTYLEQICFNIRSVLI